MALNLLFSLLLAYVSRFLSLFLNLSRVIWPRFFFFIIIFINLCFYHYVFIFFFYAYGPLGPSAEEDKNSRAQGWCLCETACSSRAVWELPILQWFRSKSNALALHFSSNPRIIEDMSSKMSEIQRIWATNPRHVPHLSHKPHVCHTNVPFGPPKHVKSRDIAHKTRKNQWKTPFFSGFDWVYSWFACKSVRFSEKPLIFLENRWKINWSEIS